MGSTAAALYVQGDQFACIWVGDSRIYLLRDGQLKRMTRDHTQVRELVERGLLAPEEAVNHPMSHVLSRGVGVMADVELERVLGRVRPQDVFLLCSDGLSGVCPTTRSLIIWPLSAGRRLAADCSILSCPGAPRTM